MDKEQTKLNLIRAAIQSRQKLTFWYRRYYREASPHALGLKDGVWHVLVWQFAGDTGTLLYSGEERWLSVPVAEMARLTAEAGPWHNGWITGCNAEFRLDTEAVTVDPLFAAARRPFHQDCSLELRA